MKQRITEEQYNELPIQHKQLWESWAKKKGYTIGKEFPFKEIQNAWFVDLLLGFPSIGNMIEFLYDQGEKWSLIADGYVGQHYFDFSWNGELTDFLWESVKKVLEKE